jgi:hypothetical protein
MGTSSSRRSPNKPYWRPVRVTVGDLDQSPERQSREIWRAATADETERLHASVSHAVLASACEIADAESNPSNAVSYFNRALAEQFESGPAFDLARRALARAVAEGGGSPKFAQEVFAELASYYASRDLPSVVATEGKVRTTSAAIELKEALRRIARAAVTETGDPRPEPDGWRQYVTEVLAHLTGVAD